MTFTLILDLAVATGTLLVMLVTGIVEWRRKPYTREDFSRAMERICAGVEQLWRAQDDAMFAGWKTQTPAGRNNDDALRRLCRGMLADMLRNTAYILERAEPCNGAAEVVRLGTRLIFRLRWAQMRLAFCRDSESVCAITADMAERYACLWSEVVRWIEAIVVERGEREPAGRSCRRRMGARAAF